jgi:hypothetical protein
MAADLEKLIVSLEANLKQYEREFARAQGLTVSKMRGIEKTVQASAGRMEAAMARAGASIKAGLVGALGAVTIGSIASGITELIKKFGELSDEAARAGVSAEFLQELGFAGLGAGVKVEQLVDLIQKFNLEIGEAATKGGPLKDLLDANNVALRDANGKIRDQQALFFDVVDLISNARTQQEAAVVAMIAMGKSAKDALPFLQQGSEAIKAGMEAAKATGGVVDEELVNAADEFADRWEYAWGVWEGQAAQRILTVLKLMDSLGGRAEKFFAVGDSAAVSLYKALSGYAPPNTNSMATRGGISGQTQSANAGGKGDRFTVIPTPKSSADAATAIKGVGKATADTTTELETMLDTMVEVDHGFLDATKAAEQLQSTFSNAFSDLAVAASDGKLKISEIMDVLGSLREQLIKMAAEKLFMMLFGSTDTGGGGILQSLFQQRASGGHVNAGQPYVVGERGREMFMPTQSGRIMPNSAMGGGVGSVTVNNYAGVQVSSQRSGPSGQDLVLMIQSIGDSRFASNLNRNAPLIGGRPVPKRTS